jgi:hypothetical protein
MRFLIFIGLLICVGCTGQNKKKLNTSKKADLQETPVSKCFIEAVYGFEVCTKQPDSAEAVLALDYLNRSEYKKCLEILKKQGQFDTIRYAGFRGINFTERVSQEMQYVMFRFNNFLDNLLGNSQARILPNSRAIDSPKFNSLMDIEYSYLLMDSSLYTPFIQKIQAIVLADRESPRIQYLLGNVELSYGDSNKGYSILRNLINVNYYKLPAMKLLLSSSKVKTDQKLIILAELRHDFPNECDISWSEGVILKTRCLHCEVCKQSIFQKDSILVKLVKAKILLQENKYSELDLALNSYFKSDSIYDPNPMLLFERGEYLDLRLRSLFLQKKYSEFCDFIHNNIGVNSKLKFETQNEISDYIKKLVIDYFSQPYNFPQFVEKNFNNCFEF